MSTPFALVLLQEAQAPAGAAWVETLRSLSPVPALRTLVMLVVGLPLVYFLAKWARRWFSGRMNQQAGLVAGKLIFYLGIVILAISALRELGFSLAPLLGAAGVLGIALGFASQTSVSNVISGFFLIAERPFVVDDLIEVGDVTGRVVSIDTLSVRLRTFDNRMVRIPNETLVKSQVVNVTRYPVRRVDVLVGVAYKEDPARVREVLLEIARDNPMCLMEPEPVVVFRGFGESSLDFLFGVWAARERWIELKNRIHEDVWTRFAAEGIEIPFPHRTLYVGAETDAFPVRLVEGEDAAEEGKSEDPSRDR